MICGSLGPLLGRSGVAASKVAVAERRIAEVVAAFVLTAVAAHRVLS
jgi:hypothetical protein